MDNAKRLAAKARNATANYKSLCAEYGITVADMIKKGASVDETGAIIPSLASSRALIELVAAGYGGA